jgi:3,2-trans-enoyl-CoA isomerase
VINVIDHGRVRELQLARPPANALNPALIQALRDGLGRAVADGQGAVVLSGAPGLFSGGLDVPELLTLPTPKIRELWQTFFALMREIAASPVPVAGALTGHSPAGGTVLALFTDYRVLAAGPFKIGLNEVQVGLPVPEVLMRALALIIGPRQAARMTIGGLLVDADEALRLGLVDELAPVEQVVPRAVAWATELLTRPPNAMATTRKIARRPLVEAFDTMDEGAMDAVMAAWSSAETQATMKAIAGRLGKGASKA